MANLYRNGKKKELYQNRAEYEKLTEICAAEFTLYLRKYDTDSISIVYFKTSFIIDVSSGNTILRYSV